MICQKCLNDYPESEIDESHDVPRYVGGKDIDGRHNLCKKCHDIYEKMVFSVMIGDFDDALKEFMRSKARSFAKNYFKKDGTENQ